MYFILQFLDIFHTTTPKYLMKVDDDTFINLPLLYQQLITHGYYGTRKHLLMGHCFCGNPQRRVVSAYHDSLIS